MLASHLHPQQPSLFMPGCMPGSEQGPHKGVAEHQFEMQLRMSFQSLRPKNSIFA